VTTYTPHQVAAYRGLLRQARRAAAEYPTHRNKLRATKYAKLYMVALINMAPR
jgi:hypothetical protein